MPITPTLEQVRSAIAGRLDSRPDILAVIAHGSWVRGDFWPGQSDLDLIVVGLGMTIPNEAAERLNALTPTLGVSVGAWPTSEARLNEIRSSRRANPSLVVDIGQFDINGFDVVDNRIVVWPAGARDPLEGFPVPRGGDLRALAGQRLRELVREIPDHGKREMNRIACDALKAATLFFGLGLGRAPTRNKTHMRDLFLEIVPVDSQGRETASAVWQLYRDADKLGDPDHQRACEKFVAQLANLSAIP